MKHWQLSYIEAISSIVIFVNLKKFIIHLMFNIFRIYQNVHVAKDTLI